MSIKKGLSLKKKNSLGGDTDLHNNYNPIETKSINPALID